MAVFLLMCGCQVGPIDPCVWLSIYTLDHSCYFPPFLAQIHLHTFPNQHPWNLSIIHPILPFVPFDALILRESWLSKWVEIDRQQNPPHLVFCSSRVKVRTKADSAPIWYGTCIQIILYFTFTCEYWCVYHICLGSWRVERCWLRSPPLSCHMTGVLKIFLQRPTIALLLHKISHVAQYVCISSPRHCLFSSYF